MKCTIKRGRGSGWGWVAMVLCLPTALVADLGTTYQPRAGDLVFQSLPSSPLVDAIEGATHSPYSHCGLVEEREGQFFVLEALGTVHRTPLSRWIAQGRDGALDAYRLRDCSPDTITALVAAAETHLGKPYDPLYQLDDDAIYCSELIYHAYSAATGQPLGTLDRLGDLDWQQYRALIVAIDPSLPLERAMITPVGLSRAEPLDCIYRGIGDWIEARSPQFAALMRSQAAV